MADRAPLASRETRGRDVTPEWRPGMGEVEGMAAHPSMQRNSIAQLQAMRIRAVDRRQDAARDLLASPEKRDLLRSMDRRIDAIKQALRWRGVDV